MNLHQMRFSAFEFDTEVISNDFTKSKLLSENVSSNKQCHGFREKKFKNDFVSLIICIMTN